MPAELAANGTRVRLFVERAFRNWFQVGGYPEAQGLDPWIRGQLLRDYVDVAMFRDVVERYQVSNLAGLRWLLPQLVGNADSRFSVEKPHAALKSQCIVIGKGAVHQILGYPGMPCLMHRVV